MTDPDGLILDEFVLVELRQRQFEVLLFEESVSFRYAYESRGRTYWDEGKSSPCLVVVSREGGPGTGGGLGTRDLPHDVTQLGKHLSLGLQAIFSTLSRTVVAALGSEHWDRLYSAVESERPGTMGDGATKDFVLRHVFGIATELVREPQELLRALLGVHHGGRSLPTTLAKHLVRALQREGCFGDWPLDAIVPDREAFFAFLQERWSPFLDRASDRDHASGRQPGSPASPTPDDAKLAYPGPAELPFNHADVRVYIDNLFLEGCLRPVARKAADSFAGTWIATGVQSPDDSTDALRLRLDRLVEAAADAVPDPEARCGEWQRFARRWAEATALEMGNPETARSVESAPSLAALRPRVDAAFAKWLTRRYAGLANLPPVPPVMLHHVPRLLAQHVDNASDNKAALLVVDGLSMDQWVTVREELTQLRPAGYRFREDAVFAWIPTLTSVSRQAAFAGQSPLCFPDSIHSTSREPKLWQRFWADRGLADDAVVYQKKLGDGSLDPVADLVSGPRVRVAGLVVDTVDKTMHGMALGVRGMHGQLRQWARSPYLTALLDLLLDNGFRVWLTSDHGNVEATGCGRPTGEKVADMRGKRAHVYSSAALRRRAAAEFPDARPWPPTGLPSDYFPLLAPGRSAFVAQDERIVGHGGASLEEVVVPLVRIDRRTDA